jgi:hypothetical protein
MDPFDILHSYSLGSVFLIAAIVIIGAIVQVGLGIGFGLIVAPLLALLDPALVPAPTLILGMFTAGWAAFVERQAIIWPEVGVATAGRIVGVVAGLAILLSLSTESGFEFIFGLMILVAVVLSAGGWQLAFNFFSLSMMGLLSGLMGTITSVGAPPLAMIYRGRPPTQARPTLSAFFALGGAASLIGLYAAGEAGQRDLVLALLMLPAMLVGIGVSRFIKGEFDRWYRSWLLVVSGAAGFLLVLRALW